MEKKLMHIKTTLYHIIADKQVSGAHTNLSGNCTNLRGNCTNLSGDCSGLKGDIDDCKLTNTDRTKGIPITELVKANG